jgi:pimeloyl-ACP methyl ester carboxylesterase
MAETALTVLKISAAVYAGLCGLIFMTQSRFVYFPDHDIAYTPANLGLAFESVTQVTTDGETIAAWFVPASSPTPDTWTVLFCHGNAGDIGDRIGSIQTFHELGLNVFIFDYRGYGDSTGNPSERGTYADAEAAWRYLTEVRGIAPERILLFGRSLGGAVASWLATKHLPGKLLLESAFTSAADMGARMFPIFPVRLLTRNRYDTARRIASIRCPVLIAHSPEDQTVPYAHGEALFARAIPPKQFVSFHGDHNSGGMDADPAYRDAFQAWLRGPDSGTADVPTPN